MAAVPHKMVRLERMSDYRGVGLQRLHCIQNRWYKCVMLQTGVYLSSIVQTHQFPMECVEVVETEYKEEVPKGPPFWVFQFGKTFFPT